MKNNISRFTFELHIDQRRSSLAKTEKILQLKQTYKKASHLKNKNTSTFWNKKLKDEATFPMSKDREKIVLNFARQYKGNYLGVGFGNANLENKLSKYKQLKIFGIDISSYSVSSAKKNLKGYFEKASLLKIPFNDNTFDLIVALEILEHISPQHTFKALSEINRVLKNNGLLVISVPLNEGLEVMVRKGNNPNEHMRIYSPELIKSELKLSGFKVFKQKLLYAFNNLYTLKILLQKYIFKNRWQPNNIIIFAKK